MYLKLFGLREKPFHITPNPRFIFLSKNHKEAFAHLLYGIQQRVGFLSLTGEIGTGKTTVLRTLLGQLGEADYRVALIFNPCLSALELLQSIHREFGIDGADDEQNLVKLHDSLNRFLLSQREQGKTVVLVIDEAQNLKPEVLEELRLLSNLETETDKLIQMVLVGQPELEQLLKRSDLRQLRQRLMVRYQLRPMDAEDTRNYIQHRLKVAGWQAGTIFDARSFEGIYRHTGGTPRLINILCDRALLVAYSQDRRDVDRRLLATARRELEQAEPVRKRRLWPGLALLALIAGLATGGSLFWPRGSDSSLSGSPARQPVAASMQPAAAPPPQPPAVAAAAEPDRIRQLHQSVAELGDGESGRLALQGVLQSWGKPLPILSQPPASRRALEDALRKSGLATILFQGELERLLSFNTPAILEVALPNIIGKRFLSLVAVDRDRVYTEPALTESGWLRKVELQEIWFGKALIPWLNFAQVSYLDRPGQTGPGVAKLQEMLREISGSELSSNGEYDWATISAVTRFQRQNRLAPDGRVGAQTLLLLYQTAGRKMPHLTQELTR